MKRFRYAFTARVAVAAFAVVLAVGLAGGQTYKVEHLSTFPGYCWALYVEGNYAYVGEGINEPGYNAPNLRVFDVSDPSDPVQEGIYWGLPRAAEGVYVSGGLAYVAANVDGLRIIDFSKPSSPTLRGGCDTIDNEYGAVDVSGLGHHGISSRLGEGACNHRRSRP